MRSAITQPLRAALAVAPLLAAGVWVMLSRPSPAIAVIVFGAAAQLSLLVLVSVRVVARWARAVIIRAGRPIAVRGPGLCVMLPFVDEPLLVDLRLRALGLQRRRVLTLDRKPVWVEAALFYQIEDPLAALLACQDLDHALAQTCHAALRSAIARVQLSTLEKRPEQVETELGEEVARRTQGWGVRFDLFRLLAVEPVYLVGSQPERAVEDTTARRLAAARRELPAELIHGEEALQRDPADEVVCFPAEVGRNLARLGDKLSD